MGKIKNNYHHFKKRLKQRYDISINRAIYRNLCKQIKNNSSICLGRQSSSKTVHQVNLNNDKLENNKLIVVYSSSSNNIVTVLYPSKNYRLQ
jgi:hypothetical protein